jgi:periodic tryptophan protein 2
MAEHELDIDSDLDEDAWQIRNQADANMPGAKKLNNAQVIKRRTKLAIRIKDIKFSPDGTQFAAATTEGLVIYSLKNDINLFNPVEIDENVTIDNIITQVKSGQHLTALLVSHPASQIIVAESENERERSHRQSFQMHSLRNHSPVVRLIPF